MSKNKHKKEVASVMNRLYQRGLTTTSGGNVSKRAGKVIYITPSQTDKGNMKPKQIGMISLDGNNLTPDKKTSMESAMHMAIYKARPDIDAVVHAHPYTATALSASENLIDSTINGEARAIIGEPAFAAYKTMGTKELAMVVAESAKQANTIILQHHGVLTVGKTLLEAFDRLEVTEMTARANVIRNLMNIQEKIDPASIQIIDDMFQ